MKGKKNFELYYLVGVLIFFVGGVLLNFKYAYNYTLLKDLMGFLFCLLLSIYYISVNKEFEVSNFIYPVVIFFVWLLISAFYAPFKFEAGKSLENYLLYFLIFIVATNLQIEKKVFYIWIASGIIASITGIFQYYGPRHYAISTFGNPNFYSGHIIMVLCLSFSNLLNFKEYRKEKYGNLFKLIDILCLFFGIWGLIVADSKAAIMAFILGLTFIWYFHNQERKDFLKYTGLIFALLIIIFFSPKIIFWYKNNIRYYIWSGTLKLIFKKPFFGWGLGNFIFFYPYFRVKEYFLQPESRHVTNHPHNEFLEIWSETGLIGLLLFLFLISFFIISVIKKREKKSNILLPGIMGGIISVLFDNIFSTNMRNPSTSMYFWFLMGITFNYFKKEKIPSEFSKILWYTIFITSFVMSVFHSYYRILPEVFFKRGEDFKDLKIYDRSIKNYFYATVLNPYNYECWYKLAYVYGEAGNYKESEKIYLYINKYLFPHYAKTDSNLGTVYFKLGDLEKSFKYYKVAEQFNPYDVGVLCSIASLYIIYYNDIKSAVEYLNRVLKIDPENTYANRTLLQLKREGKIK